MRGVVAAMRILVAGATGVLGAPTVRALVGAGHEVVGLARSPEKAKLVETFGGRGAIGDVLKPATLGPAARGAEAVIHLASSSEAFEAVRVTGCRNLVAAAQASGVHRFVVGSGYWIFGHHEGTITEASSIDASGIGRTNLAAEHEALKASRPGAFEVVVGRPGMVYGPGAWFARAVAGLRDGTYRVVGDGRNRWSPVHPADVGEAYRTLVERGIAGQAYLIVDDAPVPVRELMDNLADLLGAPPPKVMALPEAEAAMGREVARALAANQTASNAKLKGLGWRPRYPTYREGLPTVLRAMDL